MLNREVILSKNANFFKRVFSFFIDSFMIMFISSFLSRIFIFNSRNFEKINDSIDEFKILFNGANLMKLDDYQLRYLVNSPIFINTIHLFFFSFLISVLYVFLSNLFLNSSTLGQKIFSLKTVNINNNGKPNTFKILLKSILIQIPIRFIYLMFLLFALGFNKYIRSDDFLTNLVFRFAGFLNIYTVLFIFAILVIFWYDIYFITNRLILSDIISRTRVIESKSSYDITKDNKDFTFVFDKFFDKLDSFNSYLLNILKNWIKSLKK